MKYIKKYEENNQKVELIINDLIDYYKSDEPSIRSFIHNLYLFLMKNKIIIEIFCNRCVDINNSTAHSHKKHKGILYGYGYGFKNEYGIKEIYLTFNLKRIKYQHQIDTYNPITLYGNISDDIKKVIDDINFQKSIINYNL